MNSLRNKILETNNISYSNIAFLQPYAVVSDEMLEICMAIILGVLSLELLSQTNTSCIHNLITSLCIVFFHTSLSGYALLIAWQTAAYNLMYGNV
jgi:hypothetical protein